MLAVEFVGACQAPLRFLAAGAHYLGREDSPKTPRKRACHVDTVGGRSEVEGIPLAAVAALYALLSLTVIRMLPVFLVLTGTGLRLGEKLFIGWFGPRGLASVVFGVIVLEAGLPGGQDPAESRRILSLCRSAREKSPATQTEWRWGQSGANSSLLSLP